MTQGTVLYITTKGEVAMFDPEDAHLLSKYAFFVSGVHLSTRVDGKTTGVHRLIMSAGPSEFVDHRNGNGLDNRRANLRMCTLVQNSANSRKRMRNGIASSRYKGVCLDKKHGTWRAHLVTGGKRVLYKRCKDEVEAAKLYDKAAFEHQGRFARLNFPEDYDLESVVSMQGSELERRVVPAAAQNAGCRT